jgi:hypothetical protein
MNSVILMWENIPPDFRQGNNYRLICRVLDLGRPLSYDNAWAGASRAD